MHSIAEVGSNVPAFLAKLWKLVEDPTTNDLIAWGSDGKSFFIRNQAQFSRELLPLYYKHNNLASFIRQLNMYGFHKISSVDSGGLKLDKDEMEFAHMYFQRGHPYLLDNIKRKIPTGGLHSCGPSSGSSPSTVKPELVSRVLQDVRQMKGRQETLDSRFNAMKRENEALWRELALLRQKHMKQQQIVNKLIQFLVTLVQPNRGLGIKRTYPLMLNDSSNVHSNRRRGGPQAKSAKLNLISELMDPEELSPKGPVIHELDNNAEYILPDDNSDGDLDEFVCGKESTGSGAMVGAGAGMSLDKLKSWCGGYSQGEPVSPEVGAEAGDVPTEIAKELDREAPLVHSPTSSPGYVESLHSPMACTESGEASANQEDDVFVSDSDPQSNVPDYSLLPSVVYPLSPEIFMESVDPSVVSPAPAKQMTKKRGQVGSRVSKAGSKSSGSSTEKSNRSQNRKVKQSGSDTSKIPELDILTQDMYPEIHLEEGTSQMNVEDAILLNSVATGEDNSENQLNVEMPIPNKVDDGKEKEDSNMVLACTSGPSAAERDNSQSNIRETLDMHIDTMQSDLEILKDILMKGNISSSGPVGGSDGDSLGGGLEGYCLDASTLLGVCPGSLGHLLDPAVIDGGGHILSKLFSSDDPLPLAMNSFPSGSKNSSMSIKGDPDLSIAGNELATYNPTLLDLVEDDDSSQLLNWYDEASKEQLSEDTNKSGDSLPSSGTLGKSSISGSVIGISGKGTGKVNVSMTDLKNVNPARRKAK